MNLGQVPAKTEEGWADDNDVSASISAGNEAAAQNESSEADFSEPHDGKLLVEQKTSRLACSASKRKMTVGDMTREHGSS